MKVLKYEVQPGVEHQLVPMPKGAVLLDMQEQWRGLHVWAVVDPEAQNVFRDLSVVGTGWDLPGGNQAYVATAQMGSLVWHLFDGGEI